MCLKFLMLKIKRSLVLEITIQVSMTTIRPYLHVSSLQSKESFLKADSDLIHYVER